MKRRDFLRSTLSLGAAALLAGGGKARELLGNASRAAEIPALPTCRAGDHMALTINGVKYALRWCPAGTFMMGSPVSEEERWDNEVQHQVTLTCGFWMLETPVTQDMWESVMKSNPSHFRGTELPVVMVSWHDCQEYIQKLNAHLAGTPGSPAGFRFSLPTEAQWEYACRAGTTTPFNFGNTLNGDNANCNGNFPYGTSMEGKNWEWTTKVGSYPANALGLYDMHGNVWEWCLDWGGDYPSGAVVDPVGSPTGSGRVLRGGGWCSNAQSCRSAYRDCHVPAIRFYDIGLRLSLVLE